MPPRSLNGGSDEDGLYIIQPVGSHYVPHNNRAFIVGKSDCQCPQYEDGK